MQNSQTLALSLLSVVNGGASWLLRIFARCAWTGAIQIWCTGRGRILPGILRMSVFWECLSFENVYLSRISIFWEFLSSVNFCLLRISIFWEFLFIVCEVLSCIVAIQIWCSGEEEHLTTLWESWFFLRISISWEFLSFENFIYLLWSAIMDRSDTDLMFWRRRTSHDTFRTMSFLRIFIFLLIWCSERGKIVPGSVRISIFWEFVSVENFCLLWVRCKVM